MSKNRRDYFNALLKRPINMQKPLTDLPTVSTYQRLPSF